MIFSGFSPGVSVRTDLTLAAWRVNFLTILPTRSVSWASYVKSLDKWPPCNSMMRRGFRPPWVSIKSFDKIAVPLEADMRWPSSSPIPRIVYFGVWYIFASNTLSACAFLASQFLRCSSAMKCRQGSHSIIIASRSFAGSPPDDSRSNRPWKKSLGWRDSSGNRSRNRIYKSNIINNSLSNIGSTIWLLNIAP